MPKEPFIINRLRSIGYAFRGAILLVKTEASIQIQVVISLITIAAGCYFNITATEWMFQFFAIGLVLTAEGMNTAIEKIADYIQPNQESRIGVIKDVAAGAVLLSGVIAIIIGGFIYLPKLF